MTAKASVKVEGTDSPSSVEVRAGETLLEVLQRTQGLYVDAPCGGNGTCGKCAVRVAGEVSAPDGIERSLISATHLLEGIRLACRTVAAGDCTIDLPSADRGASILASFEPLAAAKDPLVRRIVVDLPPPSLEDQRPAARRLADALGIPIERIPLEVHQRLATFGDCRRLTVLLADEGVIDVEPHPRERLLGAAIDIGTSTVVAYLVNLDTGLVLGSRSAMNPQKAFGADVISRIAYASRGASELEALRTRIVEQLAQLVETLAQEAGGTPEEVVALTVAGNTTMLHLLAGVDPSAIARAPFAPEFTDLLHVQARQLGFRLHPRALLWFLPGVSAYVGADIASGIVATDMDRSDKPVLLIDLGTNCEVVLGDRSGLVACATAAGPAFEGAEIECGMAGVSGAVSRVWHDGTLHIETIGAAAPRGICGSGIMDVMSLLAETGLAEPSGRLLSGGEAHEVPGLSERLAVLIDEVEAPGQPEGRSKRLRLAAGDTGGAGAAGTASAAGGAGALGAADPSGAAGDGPTGNGAGVYFSQKDIRQVQLAKAAVAAGIEVLLAERGLRAADVEALYLSGGFGNAMRPESACRIGLFPKELAQRVRAVGNTAGRGAVLALRSRAELARLQAVSRSVRYVELSAHPLFMDRYIEHMTFPEPDEMAALDALFRSVPAEAEESDRRMEALFPDLRPLPTAEEAASEASRCLECGSEFTQAPCVTACPTRIDVPAFIGAIARRETARAADIIFRDNILGASCARSCPVEQLCEGACVLQQEGGQPVQIARLQRFAAESELRRRRQFRTPGRSTGKRVAVIGGGPAGLSCAGELALKGHRVVVYDKNTEHGGLVRYAVAPYRIYRDPLPLEAAMIAALGVEFRLGSAVDSAEKLRAIEKESDAVFLAFGLGGDPQVAYPGIELDGVWSALDFVRAIKTGDLPRVGERVGVIGGGNTAIDVAREAVRLGGREVTLYYRRTRDEMPAYPHEIEEATGEGVRFEFLTGVRALLGGDRLRSMELVRMRLAPADASGRRHAEPLSGSEFRVPVDTCLVAIGQERRPRLLEWIEGIKLDHGHLQLDPTRLQTANPKYFAGGDLANGGATAVEAIQSGKDAAESIDRFLRGGT